MAGDLGVPDSVKFDAQGYIISTQVHSGQVLRIDPRSGDRTVLAQLTPGLDNSTFVGTRLFVSNISGYVTEILEGGKTKDLVPDGLNWPLGLAMDDGWRCSMWPTAPFPTRFGRGTIVSSRACCSARVTRDIPAAWSRRGRASSSSRPPTVPSRATGPRSRKAKCSPSGFDQLYGVAIAPRGAVIFAEQGTGRVLSVHSGNVEVLATGLRQPSGVAVGC